MEQILTRILTNGKIWSIQESFKEYSLGSFIFNICFRDWFYMTECAYVRKFADDNTVFVTCRCLKLSIKMPEQNSSLVISCSGKDKMKLNRYKCYLFLSGYNF